MLNNMCYCYYVTVEWMIQFDTKSYFVHHIIKMKTTVLPYVNVSKCKVKLQKSEIESQINACT